MAMADFLARNESFQARRQNFMEELGRVVVGLQDEIEDIELALYGGGHVFLEGEPGLAKTLLARVISDLIAGAQFRRVQCTNDLRPLDFLERIGLFEMQDGAGRSLEGGGKQLVLRPGPLMEAGIVLLDEFNLLPPKVQQVVREAMEEYQITFEGRTYPLGRMMDGTDEDGEKKNAIFYTLFITENPTEKHAGTYIVPDAILERFLVSVYFSYPTTEEEREIAVGPSDAYLTGVLALKKVFTREELLEEREFIRGAYPQLARAQSRMTRYVVALVRALREHPLVGFHKPSPRADQDLIITARVRAYIEGSPVVLPRHVLRVAYATLRGKFDLTDEGEIHCARKMEELDRDAWRNIRVPRDYLIYEILRQTPFV